MQDKAIIQFIDLKRRIDVDLEIPLDISANEFIEAMNKIYSLNINTNNMKECFLKCEDPVLLIKGSRTLQELGIRTGSIIRV